MKRNPRACGYRVLVKLKKVDQEVEKKTESGIILQVKKKSLIEREQEASQEAVVVDIGPTAFKQFDDGQQWCKVGDTVLIVKYSGCVVADVEEDEVYRIINDADILLVFEGETL